jgi:hypothetical protein
MLSCQERLEPRQSIEDLSMAADGNRVTGRPDGGSRGDSGAFNSTGCAVRAGKRTAALELALPAEVTRHLA